MPSGVRKIIPARLLILTWLIMWVTTAPLFHTHLPDSTEGPASLHGGLAHTVFSPDLPGEFSRSPHVTHQDQRAQVSTRASNSPELDFVLSSEDSKSRKMGQPSILTVTCCLPHRSFLSNSVLESCAIHRRLPGFAALHGPRAPPFIVSL